MMGILMFALRLIVLLLLLVLVLMVLGLCRAASERDRAEEEAERKRRPVCYRPNDNPYPLCKGDGSEECQYCCLYEHFPEPPFDK